MSRSSVDHKVQKVNKIELWQEWTSQWKVDEDAGSVDYEEQKVSIPTV